METEDIKSTIWWGVAAIVALILLVSNPSDSELRSRLSKDGWVPLEVRRINLLLFSLNGVTGFTDARGVYVGIAGHYLGGEVQKD